MANVQLKKVHKSPSGGLTAKGRRYYNKKTGSNLKAPVTHKPKSGSKASKRKSSFCSRMKGLKKKIASSKTKKDPNSRVNLALNKWRC